MKRLTSLIMFAVLLGTAAAQTTPILTMIGSNPTWDAKGSLVTAPIQGLFTIMLSDDPTFTKQASVSYDGTDKTRTTVIDGIKLTYEQVTRAASQIAYTELGGGDGTQRKAAADKAAADAAAAKAAADAAAKAAAAAKPTP